MKIAIATVQVPFIKGGAELLASTLCQELIRRGHEADIVTIPFKWYPPETILDCILMSRMIDLKEVNGQKVDRIIALKFPAYYIDHENKVLWMLHQHRQAYDLWNTNYGDLHNINYGKDVRDIIIKCDNKFIKQAKKIFTISDTVTDRLYKYNHIKSESLYPPPKDAEQFGPGNYGDYIFCPGRIEEIKRQHLLISALKYCKSPVRIVLSGSSNPITLEKIASIIREDRISDKVDITGYISDKDKTSYYSNCLGVYNGPFQEDYGYVTLEAFLSAKPVLTHPDSGGPLEFVDQDNGFIIDPKPKDIARAMDMLYNNKNLAKRLGENGLNLMKKKNINWNYVVETLLK